MFTWISRLWTRNRVNEDCLASLSKRTERIEVQAAETEASLRELILDGMRQLGELAMQRNESLDASVQSLKDLFRKYESVLYVVEERSQTASSSLNALLEQHRDGCLQASDPMEKLSEAQDSNTERFADELAYAEMLDRKASSMNELLNEMNQAIKAIIAAKDLVKKASRVERVKRVSK